MRATGKAFATAARIMERFVGEGDRHGNINFWDIKGLESPEVLRELGKSRKEWIPLHKMADFFTWDTRCFFMKTVLENRAVIPRAETCKLWHACHEQRFGWPFITPKGYSRAQWLSAITSPLLIDNDYTIFTYVVEHKPGWRFLQCIAALRAAKRMKMSPALQKAIVEDDVPSFELLRNMEGRRVCFSLLAEILNTGKFAILRNLIAHGGIPRDVMTLEQLCCYCAAQFPDGQAVPILTLVEEERPGFLKGVRDDFGRNLLWYTVFNKNTGWFHPDCELTRFLLEKGCDPDNENQLGLSWREVTDSLTYHQKRELMQHRYLLAAQTLCGLLRKKAPYKLLPLAKTQRMAALRRTKGK